MDFFISTGLFFVLLNKIKSKLKNETLDVIFHQLINIIQAQKDQVDQIRTPETSHRSGGLVELRLHAVT